ncbi:AtpZ/AtpI family protein [Microlunatus kandeliicorticis]|uniref:AtpZ/AtpI family protein n=1 Tax=Microlunatus kandeliicorticis TaxID=1759536 RepID=UPI002E296FF1|nr:AtpZ/AtpI family protein [Microlunatus kandeliicorticis]
MLSYLISGVLLWGGAGWLVDHLAGTRHLFTPIGIVIGAGLGCYLIIHRFGALGRRGTPPADPGPPPDRDR